MGRVGHVQQHVCMHLHIYIHFTIPPHIHTSPVHFKQIGRNTDFLYFLIWVREGLKTVVSAQVCTYLEGLLLHIEISLLFECPSSSKSMIGLLHPLKIWGPRGLGPLGDLSAVTHRVRDGHCHSSSAHTRQSFGSSTLL